MDAEYKPWCPWCESMDRCHCDTHPPPEPPPEPWGWMDAVFDRLPLPVINAIDWMVEAIGRVLDRLIKD